MNYKINDYKNVFEVWFQRSSILTQISLLCEFVKKGLFNVFIINVGHHAFMVFVSNI